VEGGLGKAIKNEKGGSNRRTELREFRFRKQKGKLVIYPLSQPTRTSGGKFLNLPEEAEESRELSLRLSISSRLAWENKAGKSKSLAFASRRRPSAMTQSMP